MDFLPAFGAGVGEDSKTTLWVRTAALLQGEGNRTAASLSEPVDYVPEMIRADRLLTGFRRNSSGVRVVVDEFGGFVGVIGAEAVLAVLAGWWRRPQPAGEGIRP